MATNTAPRHPDRAYWVTWYPDKPVADPVDTVLVERVIAGKADPTRLNPTERIAVAGQMYARGAGVNAIMVTLHASGEQVVKLVAAHGCTVKPRAGAA